MKPILLSCWARIGYFGCLRNFCKTPFTFYVCLLFPYGKDPILNLRPGLSILFYISLFWFTALIIAKGNFYSNYYEAIFGYFLTGTYSIGPLNGYLVYG